MRIMNKAIWPFQITIPFSSNEHSDSMYIWCEEKYQRWYLNGNTFCFQDEKDATLFVLKWGS